MTKSVRPRVKDDAPPESNGGETRSSAGAEGVERLRGLRILIVEDVGMVAIALKSMLEELGCVVVAMPARLREAAALASSETLDGVLLDLNLGGEFSYPVADTLRARKIPFIIMSGYDVDQLRPALSDVPSMQKPFERDALSAMMQLVFVGRVGQTPTSGRSATASASATTSPKTRGEIESAVCHGMCGFELEYLGRGPKDVSAHLIGELLVVRLQGVLTAAEQHLVRSSPPEHGRDLLKRVRSQLMEGARVQVESMIQLITGVKVKSLHHDISTTTGEEIVVFTLCESPPVRAPKSR